MKRTNLKKLALNRETLASLSADALAEVAGGNALTPITRPPTGQSRITICPSRGVAMCDPNQTRLFCPQGPQK